MPWHACRVAALAGLTLIYAVESPRGTNWLHTTPQGTCIILAAVGSVACIVYASLVPYLTRQMRNKLPANAAIKRMNLLGLVRQTVGLCHCSTMSCLLECGFLCVSIEIVYGEFVSLATLAASACRVVGTVILGCSVLRLCHNRLLCLLSVHLPLPHSFS